MGDFDRAVDFVLDREGYWSELPGDPGGLTIWGISIRAHRDTVNAMKVVSREQSREIAKGTYHEDYWLRLGCDNKPWPLNLVVFDTAVNCGPYRAGHFAGDTWQEYLCTRVRWQIHESKSRYTAGLLNRMWELFKLATEAI